MAVVAVMAGLGFWYVDSHNKKDALFKVQTELRAEKEKRLNAKVQVLNRQTTGSTNELVDELTAESEKEAPKAPAPNARLSRVRATPVKILGWVCDQHGCSPQEKTRHVKQGLFNANKDIGKMDTYRHPIDYWNNLWETSWAQALHVQHRYDRRVEERARELGLIDY